MSNNNKINHFYRKKIRLKNKELYKSSFWYFVTICVEEKKCIFVETVKDGQEKEGFKLSIIGEVVEESWLVLPDIFDNILLDEFVIMPNHFHGIIGFKGKPISKLTSKESDLGKVIKRFKLLTLRSIVETVKDGQNQTLIQTQTHEWRSLIAATDHLLNTHKTIWQKSFYDHIIRDDKDLERIQDYIFNNPLNWHLDSLNPKNDQNEEP